MKSEKELSWLLGVERVTWLQEWYMWLARYGKVLEHWKSWNMATMMAEQWANMGGQVIRILKMWGGARSSRHLYIMLKKNCFLRVLESYWWASSMEMSYRWQAAPSVVQIWMIKKYVSVIWRNNWCQGYSAVGQYMLESQTRGYFSCSYKKRWWSEWGWWQWGWRNMDRLDWCLGSKSYGWVIGFDLCEKNP